MPKNLAMADAEALPVQLTEMTGGRPDRTETDDEALDELEKVRVPLDIDPDDELEELLANDVALAVDVAADATADAPNNTAKTTLDKRLVIEKLLGLKSALRRQTVHNVPVDCDDKLHL